MPFLFLCSVKVVILHQHFNTPARGGAIRSYYLAKSLVERGMDVRVIAGHKGKEMLREMYEGIDVCYLPVPYDNKFGFSARSASFLKYVTGVIRRRSLYQDADLCYAISTPLTVGLAARWIKQRHGIPYLFEVGDLWPEAPIQLGFIRNPFLKSFLYRLEREIYREAKGIVALSTAICADIEQKVKDKTIYLVPNMADTDFYKPTVKEEATVREMKLENRFVVSYIGAVGFANGLDYFLECARASLKAGLPIQFLLCGEGAMLEGLRNAAGNLQLTNVTFVPFQNRDGVKRVMDVTDAAFICYRHIRVLETGSPNKYFDGLAAGKMIIVNFGGWIRNEIEQQGCGLFVDPQRPDDFVQKMGDVLKQPERLAAFGTAARQLAERRYARKILGGQFADIISSAN